LAELGRPEDVVHVELDLHVSAVRLGGQNRFEGVEREVGGPGDEVGPDDTRGIERVEPVVGCSFPFADICLGRPGVYCL
jgi:hypothetical protein